jgi:hypothetical protein
MHIASQKEGIAKTAITFEDMCSALEEFGIVMRRPPFLEDKMN